jgi:hypothetical protein
VIFKPSTGSALFPRESVAAVGWLCSTRRCSEKPGESSEYARVDEKLLMFRFGWLESSIRNQANDNNNNNKNNNSNQRRMREEEGMLREEKRERDGP